MVTKCTNCKYIQFCRLDRTEKMHGRKCWIDEIAERGKYKPQKVLSVCLDVEKSIGIEIADVTDNIIAICGESDVFEKKKSIGDIVVNRKNISTSSIMSIGSLQKKMNIAVISCHRPKRILTIIPRL